MWGWKWAFMQPCRRLGLASWLRFVFIESPPLVQSATRENDAAASLFAHPWSNRPNSFPQPQSTLQPRTGRTGLAAFPPPPHAGAEPQTASRVGRWVNGGSRELRRHVLLVGCIRPGLRLGVCSRRQPIARQPPSEAPASGPSRRPSTLS
jgi:hypothetical protein